MRLLVVAGCPSESNSAYHVVNLASRLARHGVTVAIEFRTLVQGPSLNVLTRQGVSVSELGHNRDRFDVVVCWGARNPQRDRVAEVNAGGILVHMEDNDFYIMSILHRESTMSESKEIENLLSRANLVTGLSPDTRRLVPRGTDYFHFYPGVDDITNYGAKCPRAILEPGRRGNYLLYAGNVTPFVLEDLTAVGLAILKVNEERSTSLYLFVSGRDFTNQLSARTGGNLLLGGFLDRQLVYSLMSRSLCNVQTGGESEFDDYRFPSKIPEYLKSGAPMVSSFDNALLRSWGGKTFVPAARYSVDSWLEGISRVLDQSDTERRTLVSNANRVAAGDLSWDQAATSLLAQLRELKHP